MVELNWRQINSELTSLTTCIYEIDEVYETIEALNDSLDDNEEVYWNESKDNSKDIESHPAYFIMLGPLGNHKIEKVVFTRLRLCTSIFYVEKTPSSFWSIHIYQHSLLFTITLLS